MNDFIFYNPCKVYFGKSQLKHLPEELLHYGKMVLLVYGGGSIKKNGLYEAVTRLMMENGSLGRAGGSASQSSAHGD